tara:strand:- start:181 stop:645 length:465 start_codon:yes stop_codon:yes gene_type:complete
MKILKSISLFFCFIQPIDIRATPVKGISDFDVEFKGVERIDFECPFNEERKIQKPNDDLSDRQLNKKNCWVDFYPTYLNVMNKQVIYRNDVISFFQSPPVSGKCCASWNLIYRDNEGEKRMLSMRRNDLPFPLTKRKLKRLGTPANIINRWLVQ